jgi:uncharacterized protein with PQ loop repeat
MVSRFLIWAALVFYSICFIPQIIRNKEYRTTSGLSDFYLLISLFGYVCFLAYVFSSELPLPYKIMAPIEFVVLMVMLFQRIYYDGQLIGKKVFFVLSCFIMFSSVAFVFSSSGSLIGGIFGWMSFSFFSVNQMPQVMKIYREKSVRGFSFIFVTMSAMALALEFSVGVVEGLPMPTILMAFKGLAYYAVYCLFFWKYHNN